MSRFLVSALLSSAMALAGAAFGATAEPAKPPADFLRGAIQGDNGEIALARLGERRASSAQVRSFAELLASDHARTRQRALDLARAAGKPEVAGTSPEAQDELRKLRTLSGRAFDREFVRYMADDHRKDIREYRVQALRRQGRASRLAQMAIPVLRKHLRIAESLAPKLGLRAKPDVKAE